MGLRSGEERGWLFGGVDDADCRFGRSELVGLSIRASHAMKSIVIATHNETRIGRQSQVYVLPILCVAAQHKIGAHLTHKQRYSFQRAKKFRAPF